MMNLPIPTGKVEADQIRADAFSLIKGAWESKLLIPVLAEKRSTSERVGDGLRQARGKRVKLKNAMEV
jgi:hypothetical protein